MPLMRVGEAARYTGLHPNTIRKYVDRGIIKAIRIGNQRFIDKTELDRFLSLIPEKGGGVAIYVRVSTHKQRDAGNLERQKQRLIEYCKKHGLVVDKVIEDVASGINERRKGLKKLMRLAREGKISAIIVEYKDRLTRFGFEYLKEFFDNYGVDIIVVNSEEKSPQEELVEDLIAIVSSFAARLYGKRGARKIIKTIKECGRDG